MDSPPSFWFDNSCVLEALFRLLRKEMKLSKELTMKDFTLRFPSDKHLESAQSGSPERRQRPSEVVAAARNLEAAQRSKLLFDDEAEMDPSEDFGQDGTMALLIEQRGWDSNYGLAPGFD